MTLLRPERFDDEPAIRRVHENSFPTRSEALLVDALRIGEHLSVSIVAEVAGEIVGHVALSPVTAACGETGLGLAPLAVIETHRRQGIAARLVMAGLQASQNIGAGWVVVLGEPNYYQRFGFLPASTFGLIDEYGGGPAFQAIELELGALPVGGGLVRYGPEFAVFSET